MVALTEESWWRAEFAPPAMVNLRSALLNFWAIPSGNIGMKGDTNHRSGYHRSYAWVKNSSYCVSRTYSVSETPGNRNPGNVNWLAAMDITLPQDLLIRTCQRLDRVIRSGTLEKITEWYGNDDGDNRVDGYDNIRNAVASSDPSHLWHLHLSFDRGRANEDHTDVYYTLTGDPMVNMNELHALLLAILTADTPLERQVRDMIQGGVQSPANGNGLLTKVMNAIAAIPAGAGGGLSEDQVRAIVREELDKTHLSGSNVTP